MPTVLKSAGYATGIFGKWHLGDEPERWPSRRGFDEMFIHGCGGIGQTYVGTCGDAPGNKYFDPVINHNGSFEKTSGYCTDAINDAGLATSVLGFWSPHTGTTDIQVPAMLVMWQPSSVSVL